MKEFSLCIWASCIQRIAHCRLRSSRQPIHRPHGSSTKSQLDLLCGGRKTIEDLPVSVLGDFDCQADNGLKQGILKSYAAAFES